MEKNRYPKDLSTHSERFGLAFVLVLVFSSSGIIFQDAIPSSLASPVRLLLHPLSFKQEERLQYIETKGKFKPTSQ